MTTTWHAKVQALLGKPLDHRVRDRLELAVGVLLTATAMVGLSTVIQPSPKQLTKSTPGLAAAAYEAEAELIRVRERGPQRAVDSELSNAVIAGDIATLDRLWIPDMPLDGMLGAAARAGHEKVVVWLLDHKANVHELEGTAEAAVLQGDAHPAVVSLLLARGAREPSLPDAARAGATNAVARLIAARADVNPKDASPIAAALGSQATFDTKAQLVAMLLAAGADVTRAALPYELDPLSAAVSACVEAPSPDACLALVDTLLQKGATTSGDALASAVSLGEPTRARVLSALLAAPLPPGATSVALANASAPPPPELVKTLLARGVDWAWREGESDAALPLVAAVQRGERDTVALLVAAGAPVDRRYKNGTCALGAAIESLDRGTDFENLVEFLVAHGANVNRRLPDGRSPLFAAAETGNVRAITFLLDRGAIVNELVLDDTALDAAERNGHTPAARVLHARGGRRNARPPTW